MLIVIVNPNCPPTSIDDFDAGCERSREGSVHVTPMRTLTLTSDELAHIERTRSDVYRCLTIPDSAAQTAAARASERQAATVKVETPAAKKPAADRIGRVMALVRSGSVKLTDLDADTRVKVQAKLDAAKPAPAVRETPADDDAPAPSTRAKAKR